MKSPAIYIEYVIRAGLMQVTAIDAATGVEASVFGSAKSSREALTQNAVAKLAYVLKKKGGKAT